MTTLQVDKPGVSDPGIHRILSESEQRKTFVVLGSDPLKRLKLRESSSERPSELEFGQLFNPLLQVRRGIPVKISEQEGSVVASWPETGEFGLGDSLSAALSDLSRSIEELFFHLEDEGRLGADLRRVRKVLRHYVARRQR